MDFLAKAIAEKKKAISHKRKLLETMGDKVTSKKFVQRGTLMAIEEKKKQDEARRKVRWRWLGWVANEVKCAKANPCSCIHTAPEAEGG